MRKNKKNLSIFKRIGLIAIALFSALGSLFIPFASEKQNNFASADNSVTSYSFNGSNILTIVNGYNHDLSNGIPKSDPFYMNFDVNFYTQGNQFFYDVSDMMVSLFVDGHISGSKTIYTNSSLTSQSSSFTISTLPNYLYFYTGSTRFDATVRFSNVGFISNIYKIEIGSDRMSVSGPGVGNNHFFDYNFIRYYDTNDYYVEFSFNIYGAVDSEGFDFVRFNNRTYFIENTYSDSDIYNQGYNAGLLANQQNIYDNGFSAGKITGESIGYDKGISDSNKYNFKSLFGAVIDAPIQAFSGLFKFEFLGVNLLDFFMGILTFGVIVFVIKLLLGGK